MICLFHRFGRWEDVEVDRQQRSWAKNVYPSLIFGHDHVIRQQRRCRRCNFVQTRTS